MGYKQGQRVSTPQGPGTVAYVRMAPLGYSVADAVSVVLDSEVNRPGYVGTVFQAENVKPLEP